MSLNSDINLQYQVFDQSGNTIVDWTDTSGTSITISVEYPDSGHAYGGVIDYTVKWRATDQAGNTTYANTNTSVSVTLLLTQLPHFAQCTPELPHTTRRLR